MIEVDASEIVAEHVYRVEVAEVLVNDSALLVYDHRRFGVQPCPIPSISVGKPPVDSMTNLVQDRAQEIEFTLVSVFVLTKDGGMALAGIFIDRPLPEYLMSRKAAMPAGGLFVLNLVCVSD